MVMERERERRKGRERVCVYYFVAFRVTR
jgi:hypothetical protein